MGDTDSTGLDELGPVDYLVVEFPPGAQNFNGEMAAELARLSDAGTIRILDLLILQKAADGSVDALEIDDVDAWTRSGPWRPTWRRSSPPRTSST